MAACAVCGFVFNRAFNPALLRYGPGYDNAQAGSPRFAAHLADLVRHLVERRGVRGARIVEIGCGNGDFLRRLVTWPGADNTGIGFDPAYRGPPSDGRRPPALRRRPVPGRAGRRGDLPPRHRAHRRTGRAGGDAGPRARVLRDAGCRLDPAQHRDVGFLLRTLLAVLPREPRLRLRPRRLRGARDAPRVRRSVSVAGGRTRRRRGGSAARPHPGAGATLWRGGAGAAGGLAAAAGGAGAGRAGRGLGGRAPRASRSPPWPTRGRRRSTAWWT